MANRMLNKISAIIFLEEYNEFNYFVISENLKSICELTQVIVINRTKKDVSFLFNDSKFQIINYDYNYKIYCYNQAIKLIKNDYLSILRDDICYPEKFFFNLLCLYDRYKIIGLVGSDYPYISTKKTFLAKFELAKNFSLKKIENIDNNFNLFIFGKKSLFKTINIDLKDNFLANYLFYSVNKDCYQLVDSCLRCRCIKNPNRTKDEYLIFESDKKIAKKNNLFNRRRWYADLFKYSRIGDILNFRILGIKISLRLKKEFLNKSAKDVDKLLSEVPYCNKKGIVVVMALYRKDCKFSENLIFYLSELKKYSDFIICVGDNPIVEKELDKISDFVDYVIFKKHGEYDFGSYKIGFKKLLDLGILNKNTKLLFCNDSVDLCETRLNEVFLGSKNCDAYGITINNYCFNSFSKEVGNIFDYVPHIQSYFIILSSKIFLSKWFKFFISNVKDENNKLEIVQKYEVGLSKLIIEHDFNIKSFYYHDEELSINQFLCYLRNRENSNPLFIKHKINNELIN